MLAFKIMYCTIIHLFRCLLRYDIIVCDFEIKMETTVMSKHPGTYIREEVLPQNMSVSEASERLEIGRPAFSRVEWQISPISRVSRKC